MGESANRPRRLYPRVPRAWVALAVLAGVVVLLIVIVNLGRSDDSGESRGDLTYLEGTAPNQSQGGTQLAASIADLISADVVAEEAGTLVFTAQVAVPAPEILRSSALEFRWELDGDDQSVWTLAVSIERDAQVALISDSGYGLGTADDTLPGQLTIEGNKVEVRMDVAQIDDFPSTFEWSIASTLRAFRNETDSPRVEDRYPDEGWEEFS